MGRWFGILWKTAGSLNTGTGLDCGNEKVPKIVPGAFLGIHMASISILGILFQRRFYQILVLV